MSSIVQEKLLSILVVDDDPRMRTSLSDLLAAYSMNSTLANDGQEALELLSNNHFDLVLLDIDMPKINGLQVMSEIHQHYFDTNVIILSGENSFDNTRQAFRLGANDFLKKPYSPTELIELIRNISEKKVLGRQQTDLFSKSSTQGGVEQTLMALEDIIHHEDLAHANEIINSSPAVAFLWKNTPHYPVQFVSGNVVNLLGYTAHEFMTEKVIYKNLIHPDDVQRVLNEVKTDKNSIKFKHKPYRVISKNGEEKWVDDCSSIVRDQQGKITHYQGIILDVTDWELSRQKMLKKQTTLSHAAHHDSLTALPNRLLLLDRLQQSIIKSQREKKHLAVLFIDLDKFKPINDALGHAAGDEVLKAVATRLRKKIRAADSIARIGGDEFIVLMESVSSRQDVKSMAKKLNQALQRPIHWKSHELLITSSIGISLSPDDAENAEELIQHADMAMYQSKEMGRNTFQFYQQAQ